jgi:hypothetical protein
MPINVGPAHRICINSVRYIVSYDRHVKARIENFFVQFSDPVNVRNIEMYLEFLSRNYRHGRPDGLPKFVFSVECFCMHCISHFLR